MQAIHLFNTFCTSIIISFVVVAGSTCWAAASADTAAAALTPILMTADAAPPQRAGKRAGPAEVAPLTLGRTTYTVMHWGRLRGLAQNGGYIAASDSKSGKQLWILKIYDTQAKAGLEGDVQDVFITSMEKGDGPNLLIIKDEAGRTYSVDVKKRIVTPL